VKKAVMLLMLSMLVSGCGGSDFEWFPSNEVFTNTSSSSNTGTKPGTVMKELPFPAVVRWASDVAYDRNTNTFWLLAGLNGDTNNAPNALVQINATDGSLLKKADASPAFVWPFEIAFGSTMVYDGKLFWITSNGFSNNAPVSEVYNIVLLDNGLTAGYFGTKYNCPATTVGAGFCQGLAFDSVTSSYWSAGSDSTRLVNYQLASNSVSSAMPYSGLWSTNGVSDVTFDFNSGEVLVIKDGVIRVQGSSGLRLGTIPFTLSGTGKGDWDGTHFWVVDNTSKSLKALFVK